MDDNFAFNPPPECPVFRPTIEEFKDPLEYIERIYPIAVKTGICKIIPPDEWRPPFSVNVNTFQFNPRVQKLYELEAQSRIKLNFMTKLSQIAQLQGSEKLKVPNINQTPLDLYTLYKLVMDHGGYDHVTANKYWPKIASKMFNKNNSTMYMLRVHYEKLILPYERLVASNKSENNPFYTNSSNMKPKPVLHPSTTKKQRKSASPIPDADIVGVESNELRRLHFKGAGPKTFTTTTKNELSLMCEGSLKRKCLDDVICVECGRGDREEKLLICDNEECVGGNYHADCLEPKLTQIPKQSWKCPKCVLEVLTKKPVEYGFPSSSINYSLHEFGRSADRFKANYFNKELHEIVSCSVVEKEFWRILQSFNDDIIVEYGADIHSSHQGSGFPTLPTIANGKCARNNGEGDWEMARKYSEESWNLNNLPINKKSILRFIRGNIDGMKIPWCYVGMVFSSFCWHIEDHWSYSINYLHWGEPKTWYGVSSENADKFEAAMRKQAPELFESHPDLLHHITTIMNPNILQKDGIPIFRTDQQAGQFVITFPRAYHAGFNQGFNFAEAVNFCPANWLPKGGACVDHYAQLHRHCVFSHEELLCTIAEAALMEQEIGKLGIKQEEFVIDADKFPLMAGLGLPVNQIQLDTNIRRTVYSELKLVIEKEKMYRRLVDQCGITETTLTNFENMNDDERACVLCQTTCFMSALQCSCINEDLNLSDANTTNPDIKLENRNYHKIYCLRHVEQCCSNCNSSQLTFHYRFSISQLEQLLKGLEIRLHDLHNWETEIRENCGFQTNGTITTKVWTLEQLHAKLTEGSQCRFDSCQLFLQAKELLERGKNLCSVCIHWLRIIKGNYKLDCAIQIPKSVLVDTENEHGEVSVRQINVDTPSEENVGALYYTIKSFPLKLPACDDFMRTVERLLEWRTEAHGLLDQCCSETPSVLLPRAVRVFEEARRLFPGWASFTNERTALMLLGKSLQWLLRVNECENALKETKDNNKELAKDSTVEELLNHGENLLCNTRETTQSDIGTKYLLPLVEKVQTSLDILRDIVKKIGDIRNRVPALPRRTLNNSLVGSLKNLEQECLSIGVQVSQFDDYCVRLYKYCLEIMLPPYNECKYIDLEDAIYILDLGSKLYSRGVLDRNHDDLTQKHVAAKSQVTLLNRSIRNIRAAFLFENNDDSDLLSVLLPRNTGNYDNAADFRKLWNSAPYTNGQAVALFRLYQSMIVKELNCLDFQSQIREGCCVVCGKLVEDVELNKDVMVEQENKPKFCQSCQPRSKRPSVNEIAQLNKLLKQCSSLVFMDGMALQALSKRTVTWLESLVALFRMHLPCLYSMYREISNPATLPVCIKELFSQVPSNISTKIDQSKLPDILNNLQYLQRVGYSFEVNVDIYITFISCFIDHIRRKIPGCNDLSSIAPISHTLTDFTASMDVV